MFSTGYVRHYIKEYSKKETEKFKKIASEYIDNNSITPKVAKGSAYDNLVDNLPIGTILCIDLSNQTTKNAYICLPIFSSHFSLPLKTGEIVWFYKNQTPTFDDTSKKAHPMLSIENYWLSRKVGSRASEDLSFAFLSRDVSISNKLQTKDANLKPGASTLSLLLEGAARVVDIKTTRSILEELSSKGITPKVYGQYVDIQNDMLYYVLQKLDYTFKPGLYRQTEAFLRQEQNNFCTLEEQVKHADLYSKIAGY